MKKILVLPVLIILLPIIIFILAGVPFVLNFAKNKIESTIQSQIGLPVHIGSLKGNLLYRIEVIYFNVGEVASIGNLKISYNLFPILFRKISINLISIDDLHIDLDQINKITDNLKSKEQGKTEKPAKPFEISIKRLELYNSNLTGMVNQQSINVSILIRGMLTSRIFFIDELIIKTKRSNLFVSGSIPFTDENMFDLRYSLNLFPEEFGIDDLSGNIQSRGDIQGTYLHPKISSSNQLNIVYQKNRISGTIGLHWTIPYFDSLNINAELYAQSINNEMWTITLKKTFTNLFAGIASQYGEIRLPGSITGSLENPKLKCQVQGRIKFKDFVPEIKGDIAYENRILTIKNFRLKDRIFCARIDATLNTEKSEIIKGKVNVDCIDISLINCLLKEPAPIQGKLSLNAQLSGKIDNPIVSGKLSLNDISYYNETISQADFIYKFKNATIHLEQGLIKSPRGMLNIKGKYGLKDSSFTGKIFSESIKFQSPEISGKDTIPLSGDLGMDIELYGKINNINGKGKIDLRDFRYDKWIFDRYAIEFSIKNNTTQIWFRNDKNTIILSASVQLNKNYPFNCHLALQHFLFEQYAKLEKAYVSAEISAIGELSKPEMTRATIRIDSLYLSALENEIQNPEPIIVTIEKGICYIQKSIISIQKNNVLFEGHIPFTEKDGEIDMVVKAEHIHLGTIYAMFSKEQPPGGYLDINLTIKGNMNAPRIEGSLNLEQIAYSLPGVRIDSVYALVRFQKTYFDIEYLNGKINKGRFEVNGFAELDETGIDTIAINLLLKNIDYANSELGSVIISGFTQLNAKKDTYNINGEIILDRAIYDKPFNLQSIVQLLTTANRPAPEQSKLLKQIYCNIGISSPNGIRIANNIASVNVDADLQVKGFLSRINVYGTVKTSSPGTIMYLGKRFDINSALIQFDNPYQINPVLDLEASNSVISGDGEYDITMHLTGTIEKWHLRLASVPPIPEQDIVSLLLIGRRRTGTNVLTEIKDINLKGMAKEYAIGLARGTIERTAEKGLGLEKFTITGDLLEPRHWDIGLEKKIGKKLTFIYGTGIETWEMRRIGINYNFNDNLSIYTLHDQANMNSSIDLNWKIFMK